MGDVKKSNISIRICSRVDELSGVNEADVEVLYDIKLYAKGRNVATAE